ncbi:hypothetical protein AB0E04_05055 [Streptomyces sp. NPDC048251]|uniref:DUF7134 domain-containing protein n=1 Tax=Streptomyces sp. NPDC048251 TaxID=3154501 RepID=UPI0034397252
MTTTWQRHLRDHPRTVDTAVAVALFVAAFPGSMYSVSDTAAPDRWWPCVLLAGISCTTLVWRRTRPRPVTAVAILCATGMALAGYVMTALLLAPSWSRCTRWPRTPNAPRPGTSPSPP